MKIMIIACLFLGVVLGAISQDSGDCTLPEGGTLENGKIKLDTPGVCEHRTCDNGELLRLPCGLLATTSDIHCKIIPEDYTKPHPHCCAQWVCSEQS